MKFDKLWEHQQGAVFLKKDEIYTHRKSLAEYFYRMGSENERERAKVLVEALEFKGFFPEPGDEKGIIDDLNSITKADLIKVAISNIKTAREALKLWDEKGYGK